MEYSYLAAAPGRIRNFLGTLDSKSHGYPGASQFSLRYTAIDAGSNDNLTLPDDSMRMGSTLPGPFHCGSAESSAFFQTPRGKRAVTES